MKVVFECETEVGKCEDALIEDSSFAGESYEPWSVIAHTVALLNGSKHMLKIEQRCYLRRGDQVLNQTWLKPEVIFEPMLGDSAEMESMARQVHSQFLAKARCEIPENCLAATC
ncbi:MAG: hypothetical protein FJ403_07320 [Verrucomicrobia bacterium]|nr:hypothetical protein [Verrucomicrobiota bacterium]